eukprot:Rhum_TRINITY_DN10261_c0_g1::Rhum_TRINITY_DN10261_c0_g1_i1::g.37590::m.37590
MAGVRASDSYAAFIPQCLTADGSVADYQAAVQRAAAEVLAKGGDGPSVLVRVVADLLEVLVCENFTGLMLDADKERLAAVYALGEASNEHTVHRKCLEHLIVDGEVVNRNMRAPVLLIVLNSLVEAEIEEHTPSIVLWRARTYFTHQRMLENRSHRLLDRATACYAELLARKDLAPHSAEVPDLSEGVEAVTALPSVAELHLAKGLMHYYYHEPHHSNEHLRLAKEASGISLKVTAMMGVRTEHQVFETAQLMVRVASAYPSGKEAAAFTPPFQPECVAGSNVLNRPRRLEENIAAGGVEREKCNEVEDHELDTEVVDTPLTALEQAIVMGMCVNVRNNNPMHGLTEEERLPYLERLLVEDNMPWVVRSQVHLLRSRMEQQRVRVRERGLMQFCELCDQFSLPVKNAEKDEVLETSVAHRYRQFWTVLFPPVFKLKAELGDVYVNIGLTKSALDIHESLKNWSMVIKCCKKLEKHSKAENLLLEMIEKEPEDPMLWSHLGDATRKAEHYEKAWEMSRHRLAAPMRGLGELYLEKERFADAVECFDNALKLNPIYGANWFSMGWAAIKTGQWERASLCYTRNVQIDYQDGQSWSNLATCYLQMGDGKLVQAYHCLVQAKKWSPKSWRVSDNLFTVAVELGERSQAIQVLNELVEEKGREYKVDGQLVQTLIEGVRAVLRGEEEVNRKVYKVKRAKKEGEAEAVAVAEDDDDDDEETLEDEIFDIVPFGADMDLDDELLEATEYQVERRQAEAAAAEAAKVSAVANLRKRTHQTLGKLTSVHTSDNRLYHAFADFLEECDNPLEAFDQRMKDLRCLVKRGWQAERATAMATIASATRLVEGALKVSESVLEERTVKTMPPRSQAAMQVQPVLKLAEDGYGATPEYAALKAAAATLSA